MTSTSCTPALGKRWIVAALLATFLAVPGARAADAPAAAAAPAADAPPAKLTPAEKKAAAIAAAKEAAAAKKAALAEKKAAAIQAAKDKKEAQAEKLKAAKAAAAEKKAAAIQAAKDKKAALADKLAAAKAAAAEKKAAAIQAAKDKKEAQAEKLKAAKEAAAAKKAAALQAIADKKAAAAEKLKAAKDAAAAKKAAALQAIADKKAAAAAAKAAALELKLHPPGTLTLNVTPAKGLEIDLTDPAGTKVPATETYANKLAKPGTWKLSVHAPGFEAQTQDIEVVSHKPTAITVALKQLGALYVLGAPAGAKLTITGPGGYATRGVAPWVGKGLASGDYRVDISASGYRDGYQTAAVKIGETTNLNVHLEALPAFPGMVRVPGGTFSMGSNDGEPNEKPVTTVTLSAYFIDKTNVTVGAFADCVRTGKCSAADATTVSWPTLTDADKAQWSQSCNWGKAGRENHPMNCVDWNTAKAYCEAQGRRLPTEAEWEFAARGTDSRVYPWGNEPPSAKLANACGTECRDYGKKVVGADWKVMHETDDGWPTTSPVGSYPAGASPFGLLDMAGNVWQWVADAYAPYPGGTVTNPLQQTGQQRVDRGGGWQGSGAARLRSALRDTTDPAVRVSDLGFRCARSESQ